ncbi:hypothetical protein PoB_001495400 [Plakobranchus ocellatus]|uniref:Uncharacterized protein n=1 Tax=Plakobranchus ocellatus TaxID=259542 RepID=A0AAV3Z345_9GAST|nr:hypothetical protein PoB_001495400 [Plakobranchus ocellatus]
MERADERSFAKLYRQAVFSTYNCQSRYCPPSSSNFLFFHVLYFIISPRGVGSTVACESALRSAGTLLSRVRAPLPAPWPDADVLKSYSKFVIFLRLKTINYAISTTIARLTAYVLHSTVARYTTDTMSKMVYITP